MLAVKLWTWWHGYFLMSDMKKDSPVLSCKKMLQCNLVFSTAQLAKLWFCLYSVSSIVDLGSGWKQVVRVDVRNRSCEVSCKPKSNRYHGASASIQAHYEKLSYEEQVSIGSLNKQNFVS